MGCRGTGNQNRAECEQYEGDCADEVSHHPPWRPECLRPGAQQWEECEERAGASESGNVERSPPSIHWKLSSMSSDRPNPPLVSISTKPCTMDRGLRVRFECSPLGWPRAACRKKLHVLEVIGHEQTIWGSWRQIEEVIASWVHWFNHEHSSSSNPSRPNYAFHKPAGRFNAK